MNSHDQNPTPEPEVSTPPTPFLHRGNGKIARLPKALRDQVNHWLADGVSYPDIIERLGDEGKDLRPDNLSEWKKKGYQAWLLEQTWLAETRARQEPATSLSNNFDATQLNHAALQLGTLQIFEALRDLNTLPPGNYAFHSVPNQSSSASEAADEVSLKNSPVLDGDEGELSLPLNPSGTEKQPSGTNVLADSGSQSGTENAERSIQNQPIGIAHPRGRPPRSQLDFKLGGDAAAFVRLINALARASRETMVVQKYRDACDRARAALQGLRDPERKLSDSERHAIVRNVDEILGLASAAPQQDTPSTNRDASTEH